MPSRSNPFFRAVAACAFACVLAATPALAATLSAECKVVVDASKKQITTPSHAYSTSTGLPGQKAPKTYEAIYVGDANYILVGGKWRRGKLSMQDALQMKDDNIRNATSFTCTYLRDDAVNGESAALYSADSTNEGIRSIGQIWISKSSGLPLKIEQDQDADSAGKFHMSTRYEYGNVQAPAGVP